METIYAHPGSVGVEGAGLIIDESGFRWSARKPPGSWSYRGKLTDEDMSMDELLRLEDPHFDALPHKKFLNSLPGNTIENPPWSCLMPKREYLSYLQRVVERLRLLTQPGDGLNYYKDAWNVHRNVFRSIERFAAPSHEIFSDECGVDSQSFKPRGSYCEKITYNRFGTRTGRLTVVAGPRILTLKREARKFLRSRWGDNGKIISFDFSALEVRLMMADESGIVPSVDPYLELSSALGGSLSRESSKLALISTVYGATEHGISGSLHTSIDEARRIRETISSRYGTQRITDAMRSQYMRHGFVRNRYGRRVEVPDAGDGPLLNSYLQSTGVDACLFGFAEIIDRLPENHAVPVALLHDALIVDCTADFFDKVSKGISVPVKGYDGKFPIKVSTFN